MTPVFTIGILIVTGLVTFAAFSQPELRERLLFSSSEILGQKQYERLFTSALIHGDLMHFAFNAFTLYSFGQNIEMNFGPKVLLFIYLASILGGSRVSLLIYRNQE
jgi:membrane associated rhomboid family serine protease